MDLSQNPNCSKKRQHTANTEQNFRKNQSFGFDSVCIETWDRAEGAVQWIGASATEGNESAKR